MTMTCQRPPSVAALAPPSTPMTSNSNSSNSHRLALCANKNKNWRANYLRALNIVTPDVTTSGAPTPPVVRRETCRRTTATQLTGSGRSELVVATSRRWTGTGPDDNSSSNSNSTHASSTRGRSVSTSSRPNRSRSSSKSRRGGSPGDDRTSKYVFGLRSHLFRARRVANRSDYGAMGPSGQSAPIKIPTRALVTALPVVASPAANEVDRAAGKCLQGQQRRCSRTDYADPAADSQTSAVQLLSWEEPLAMLGQSGWPLERDERQVRSCRRSRRPHGIAEECDDTEDEDVDVWTHSEDEGEDIFKMEFDSGATAAGGNACRTQRRASKGRPRANVGRCRPRRSVNEDDDGRADATDAVTHLSASFVPPHQLVEHGCFSLGLRDELKRKPGVYC
ncbi:unnamed protein product [Hyaloperonospora brassicae]|uniref:Uncharacterized protein n=1 Tax=Hyaloperonospora brassicae TaxID=162125 RepID=A0AAV0T7C5_HYABA|nr:unnamed protein product [Hyaloperonospora brassicae]